MLGFLKRLFGNCRNDPTRDWVEDANLRLVFDLDHGSLCGVQPGSYVRDLRALGPTDRGYCSTLSWYEKGLEIGLDDAGAITSLAVMWRARVLYHRRKFCPFVGDCLWRGALIELNGQAGERDILELFGEP